MGRRRKPPGSLPRPDGNNRSASNGLGEFFKAQVDRAQIDGALAQDRLNQGSGSGQT